VRTWRRRGSGIPGLTAERRATRAGSAAPEAPRPCAHNSAKPTARAPAPGFRAVSAVLRRSCVHLGTPRAPGARGSLPSGGRKGLGLQRRKLRDPVRIPPPIRGAGPQEEGFRAVSAALRRSCAHPETPLAPGAREPGSPGVERRAGGSPSNGGRGGLGLQRRLLRGPVRITPPNRRPGAPASGFRAVSAAFRRSCARTCPAELPGGVARTCPAELSGGVVRACPAELSGGVVCAPARPSYQAPGW
jgi:hypothetical protein